MRALRRGARRQVAMILPLRGVVHAEKSEVGNAWATRGGLA